MKKASKRALVLLLALVMIFGSLLIKQGVMSDFGNVKVDAIKINGINEKKEEGILAARIFVPKTATPETPAPGIVLVSGGNAQMEYLDDLAIEFSRRGYVSLIFDPFTVGRSDAITIGTDAGTISAYDYLCNLDFVDASATAICGHSAGTGRGMAAALDENSKSKGPLTVINFCAMSQGKGYEYDTDMNVAWIAGKWDHTRTTGTWGVATPDQLNQIPCVLNAMGMTEGDTYEFGKLYYNDEGYARACYTAKTCHLVALLTPSVISQAMDFMTATVPGGNGLSSDNLIYFWTEVLSAIAFIGAILLLFPLGGWLLDTKFFSTIVRPVSEPATTADAQFYFYLLLPGIISGLAAPWMVFNGQNILNKVPWLTASNTNGIIFWFLFNSALTLLILFLRMRFDRRVDINRMKGHLQLEFKQILKALLLSIILVGAVYLACMLTENLFDGNVPRLWKLQLNTLTPVRIGVFFAYIPLYLICNLVGGYSQTLGLRLKGAKSWLFPALVWFAISLAPLIFIGRVYGTLFLGYESIITNVQMSRANGAMWAMLYVFLFTPFTTTHFYKKTGSFYTGAFINSCLLCWTAVATELLRIA